MSPAGRHARKQLVISVAVRDVEAGIGRGETRVAGRARWYGDTAFNRWTLPLAQRIGRYKPTIRLEIKAKLAWLVAARTANVCLGTTSQVTW